MLIRRRIRASSAGCKKAFRRLKPCGGWATAQSRPKLLLVVIVSFAGWTLMSSGQNSPSNLAAQTASPDSAPPSGTATQSSPQPAEPSSAQSSPAEGSSSADQESGVFVFKKEVEEVILHATVIDDRSRSFVTDLDKSAFTVFENGQPQKKAFSGVKMFPWRSESSSTTPDRCATSATR